MATKRPSFLKRQKEQKRTARAAEKRDARKVRKETKSIPDGEIILEEIEITGNSPE